MVKSKEAKILIIEVALIIKLQVVYIVDKAVSIK